MQNFVIFGREYRPKDGYTSHSVIVYVNGEYIGRAYGSLGRKQYLETATDLLETHGYVKRLEIESPNTYGLRESLSDYVRRTGGTLVYDCARVGRKKDL